MFGDHLLYSHNLHLCLNRYCKEKIDVGHYLGLKKRVSSPLESTATDSVFHMKG